MLLGDIQAHAVKLNFHQRGKPVCKRKTAVCFPEYSHTEVPVNPVCPYPSDEHESSTNY